VVKLRAPAVRGMFEFALGEVDAARMLKIGEPRADEGCEQPSAGSGGVSPRSFFAPAAAL